MEGHSGLPMADLMDSQREVEMERQRQWWLVIHLEMPMVQLMADHSGLLMADLMDSQKELKLEHQRQ